MRGAGKNLSAQALRGARFESEHLGGGDLSARRLKKDLFLHLLEKKCSPRLLYYPLGSMLRPLKNWGYFWKMTAVDV